MIWYVMVYYGWYGMVWYSMVWYGNKELKLQLMECLFLPGTAGRYQGRGLVCRHQQQQRQDGAASVNIGRGGGQAPWG